MDIQTIKKLALPVLKKHGITRAGLFGSAVRDEMNDKSDIDLLVELPKTVHGFDYVDLRVGLQEELELILKRRVDVVEYNLIKPALQPYILSSQIQIL